MKICNIQFHENPSSGGRVDKRERTDRQEDTMKLISIGYLPEELPTRTINP